MCVIRDEVFSENRGIMDYNLTLFKDSIRDILLSNAAQQQQQQQAASTSASSINDLSTNAANLSLN